MGSNYSIIKSKTKRVPAIGLTTAGTIMGKSKPI